MDSRPTSSNRRAISAWLITLAATAASTYALDAVATAAGVLLVASQLLTGLDHPLVLAFLAATYLTWRVTLGANLGAAACEYGLARLTRGLLRRGRYASFDSDWVPRDYLSDYYRVVEPDERETIAFFAAPTDGEIAQREELTRSKITRLVQVDARRPVALEQRYATVISAYCADSATDDRFMWETLMANITGLVGSDSLFLTAALRRCRTDSVGDKQFPSANVDEHDLRRVLVTDFIPQVAVRELHGHEGHGYSSVVLARAQRREGPARRPARAPRPVRGLRSGIRITDGRSA